MLQHLGCEAEAQRIENAVTHAVRSDRTTIDVGGKLGTRECAEWIASNV
jgi:isocitrate/isopropylmalate dehydrogenase